MKKNGLFLGLWIVGWMTGLGALSAVAMAPPITEEFLAEALPSGVEWLYNSSTEGRIEIAYDETDSITQLVPLTLPSASSSLGGNRKRGNYYACTNSGVLVSQGIRLDRSQAVNVTFFMYESATENGTYTLLATNVVSAGIGTGIVSSGAFNLPMAKGKYYLLGAGWDASATYYYKGNYHPNTMPLGNTVGGYSPNTGTPPAASLTGNPTTTAYQQEVTVLANRVMRMDDSVDGSLLSTNSVDLLVNLAGYTDVKLKFRHRASGEESHPADGIFLSDDSGSTFTKIYTLSNGTTGWQNLTLDIDALAAANSVSLTSSLLIRFQQADNWGWPSDGREFDDIQVYSKPDLVATSLKSGGNTSITKLWKGFSSQKNLFVEFEVTSRAGLNIFSAPSVNFGYELKDSGGVTRWSQSSSTAWSMNAMETKTDTRYPWIQIPAATKLSDLNYTLHAIADAQNDVVEALESNNEKTIPVTVNHYSGSLWFDDIETDITISSWSPRVTNSAIEHTISGTGVLDGQGFVFTNLKVDKNLTTLDYTLDATEGSIIHVASPDRDAVGGVTFWRDGGIDLSKAGGYANIKVLFPAGLGVSTTSREVLESTYTFNNRKLTSALFPAGTLSDSGTFEVVEETKPIGYTATQLTWVVGSGTFSFAGSGVWSVRDDLYNALENSAALLVDPAMAEKKSNAAYYRGVSQLLTDPLVETGVNGEAQLSTQVVIDQIQLTAHFPYGVQQEWSNGSILVISRDLIDGSVSALNDAAGPDIPVSYARDCYPAVECSGSIGAATLLCTVNGNTMVGSDGGLRTPIALNGYGKVLWGTRWDNGVAHSTTDFSEGSLYIPGHFVRGDLSAFNATDQRGPAEILLSGLAVNPADPMERPSQPNYADGLADYAGLNLRVGSDGSVDGDSVIGGTLTGQWPLTGRSKYYLRQSGVSGIHEAVFNSFPSSLTIYDYTFGFANYGLSFLSGTPKDSRINGDVAVPFPNNIRMDFEKLELDCLGELEDAELANSDPKTLEYWDADVQPLTLFFAPTASSTCGNSARKLCMGLTTQCANVDQVLSGVLGFLPTGELGAPADQIEGVPSRLAAPNQIELAGPGNETYYFNPVANPYYNDFILSADSPVDRGWINFAGNLDVAFFSDLRVQFHTSASTNSAIANIYMMGGWPSGADTFFNSDPDAFDTDNAGYPIAALSYTDYRSPSDDTYRARAQRTWLGVVDFDYPLDWSSGTKSFKSPQAVLNDLMVMEVEHQTDYLSAENAEISFGVQYDGLPQVNLANMAFNAINEATGMASAFGDAVGAAVRDTIDEGVAAMDDTLSDLPEKLFDPVFEQLLDPLVDDFFDALDTAYAGVPDADYYSTVVTQFIYGVGGDPVANVDYILKNLADGSGSALNLIGEIDGNLAEAESLINAFIGTVSATNGVALPSALPGLLDVTGGEYNTLADLGVGILSVLAQTLYDSLSATIEEELNAVLEDVAPSLEAITEVMQELLGVIGEVRTKLAVAGSMTQELDDILNSVALDNPLDDIAREINQWFAALPNAGAAFDEYSAAEIKQMIRRKVTDAFYASVPCADVQQVVRSQLYEVDAAIQQSIDSAFQQLNQALRDLAGEFLTGIDDEINGMLGDLSNIMGAGQIEGYAHIRHDSLSELRIDGKFQWEVPDEMEFNAFLIIKQLDSGNSGGCGVVGEVLPEVTLGTTGFGINWLESDIKADIATKFTFRLSGGNLQLIGLGGSFELVEGEIGFESFAITEFYAAVALGALENYLSANLRCSFTSYEVEGGAFFGKACSLDPFSWDPDVQGILGDPPFTGVYVYGEGWMPIVDFGCLFRVKAGVGAGIFAFVDGPVGGKIFLGADGEALCVVSVSGDVTLVGLKDGDDLRMKGKGRISGRVGACPFCVKFGKTVTITYDNGSWDADY